MLKLKKFVIVLPIILTLGLFVSLFYLSQYLFTNLLLSQKPINPNKVVNNFEPLANSAIYNNKIIALPNYSEFLEAENYVLGVNKVKKNKTIKVDLAKQRVYAYEGNKKIYDFLISSGLWGKTPTGKFSIWSKVRFQKMEGGFGPTYYNLPNVPYVMFFYNEDVPRTLGFSFHGTYWHSNFGHPMSHGCLNMKTEEAAMLYYWANPELKGEESINSTNDNPGTSVEIYGKPSEG